MTVLKVSRLYCDGGPNCPLEGRPWHGAEDLVNWGNWEVRAQARKEGWETKTGRGGRDLCPDCK